MLVAVVARGHNCFLVVHLLFFNLFKTLSATNCLKKSLEGISSNLATNVHLDSSRNWLDFGGHRLLWTHITNLSHNPTIRLLQHLTYTSNRIKRWHGDIFYPKSQRSASLRHMFCKKGEQKERMWPYLTVGQTFKWWHRPGASASNLCCFLCGAPTF